MENLRRIGLLLIMSILLMSCDDNKIKLIYVNWSESIAMTNVVKILLEEQGYEVEMRNADIDQIFASLSKGNDDIFMDVWLPVTHYDYMKQYASSLELLGDNFDNARIGLVVPSYVTINSIEELNKHKDKFKGEIVGIDAGAGLMRTTEAAIENYDLDFKLITASETIMTNSLKEAIDSEKWVVVTGWIPHWKFSRFDLKMLEDPNGIYGDTEQIKTIARKGFKEDHPFVAKFISMTSFTTEQIESLMQFIEDGDNEYTGAKAWIDANRELTNSWLPTK